MELCRVVLVDTHYPGNLGSVARAMANMGLRELVLVRPLASRTDDRARRMATHGEPVLDAARTVQELSDAVADCVVVAGTTARVGGLLRRQTVATPDQAAQALAADMRQGRPVALVFGSEPNGLSNETVAQCHQLICIPTAPDHPTLNLAQAAAICFYELRRAWEQAEPETPKYAAADAGAQERAYRELQTALEEIHFLYGPKAEGLMHAVRHLLGRARPSCMEVKLLHGLARQIRWYVANRGGQPPAPDA
jgi:tRNA/rRNA methyltransferase